MKMEFIIVTGLSGAGKSVAVDAVKFAFVVDNIPPKLISTFYDLCHHRNIRGCGIGYPGR